MRLGFFAITCALLLCAPLASAERDPIWLVIERDGECILGVGPFCTLLDAIEQGLDIRFGAMIVCGQVGSDTDVNTGTECGSGTLHTAAAS